MELLHKSWLGRMLNVISSTDPGLAGRSGLILKETRRTFVLQSAMRNITMAKQVIRFTIDEERTVIDGSLVMQRPEDRIHRRYRK